MRVKLLFATTYLLGFAVLGVWSSYSSDETAVQQSQRQTTPLRLDTDGRRGLVLFDHRKHEALINPDRDFPHKTTPGLACTGCHHTVKDVTETGQFRKCSSCHRSEGHPDNPDDRNGYDLNSREIYHRLCISCHRASNIRTSNYRLTNAAFTKCGDCHDRDLKLQELAGLDEEPPKLEVPAPRSRSEFLPIIVETPKTPVDPPLGFAGGTPENKNGKDAGGYSLTPDRWRIGFPEDPRYKRGRSINPYRQNVLKGDYPIFGQHNFLVLTAESESLINARRIPVPSDISSQRPDSAEFFGRGGQSFIRQNFVLSVDLFHGDTAFKPVDWRIRVTPHFNINYLNTQENGIVNIDVRRGANRLDGHVGLQEAFGEVRLGDTTRLFPFLRGRGNVKGLSPFFDTTSVRFGIQPFISDFRGFIFSDFNLGVRLFGNYKNNRYQFNAAFFNMLEKDTNSDLNTIDNRNQTVFIANLFRQDTHWKGYTTQLSFHYNNDHPSTHFDVNNFLVRPAPIGAVAPHGVKAAYLGFAGEGHMGRWNITHAFYQALGNDSRNLIAGQQTDINAQMAAAELSLDRDWIRFKGSFFWSSGDKEPFDNKARGFDTILDLPEFAGGKFSFWNSQGIRLTQTGVALVNPDSLVPSLRSSKIEGQANFVNPGLFLYNLGLEAELTPKLRGILNLNYLHFHHTEPLEELLFQPGIRRNIGLDYGIGVLYRPFLSENATLAAGFSSLRPGVGFKDIFASNCGGQGCGARPETLYSVFFKFKLSY